MESGLVGQEERHRGGDVVRLGQPPEEQVAAGGPTVVVAPDVLGAVRPGQPRADRVDPDALTTQVVGQGAGQGVEGRLGRGVGGHRGRGLLRRAARDVDDGPAAVGQAPGHRLLDERHGRPGVEDHGPATGRRCVMVRAKPMKGAPPTALASRSIRPNSSMAVSTSRAGSEALSAEPGQATTSRPSLLQGRFGRPQPRFGAGVDDHRCPLQGQSAGRRRPDARIGGGAGHDGHLPLEPPTQRALVHWSPPEGSGDGSPGGTYRATPVRESAAAHARH